MKPTMMVAVATLLAVVVSSAMAAGKIYRATKPYWWSVDPMKCRSQNEHGAYWCRAGAWQIRRLNGQGEDSLAAWGYAGYDPGNKKVSLSIVTNFRHRNVTFTCAGQTAALPVKRERTNSRGQAAVMYEYWIWAKRAVIEGCLLKPLTMTVDGRAYRLDTKLLRRAVENAIDRASG